MVRGDASLACATCVLGAALFLRACATCVLFTCFGRPLRRALSRPGHCVVPSRMRDMCFVYLLWQAAAARTLQAWALRCSFAHARHVLSLVVLAGRCGGRGASP